MDLAEIGFPGYELWFDDATEQAEIWSNKTHNRSGKMTGWLKPRLNRGGYYQLYLTNSEGKKKNVLLHRIVGLMCLSNPEGFKDIDHQNEDKTDNSMENLRWVSRSTNNRNRKVIKGYSWNKLKKKWRARVNIDDRYKHLGYFEREEDARKCYVDFMTTHFPEVRDFSDEETIV